MLVGILDIQQSLFSFPVIHFLDSFDFNLENAFIQLHNACFKTISNSRAIFSTCKNS